MTVRTVGQISFDEAYQKYRQLLETSESLGDIRQKMSLFRTLTELLILMELLLKLQ